MGVNRDHIIILAIETSCDDTSVAVLLDDKLVSNVVSSQIIHKQYGGVVPELASREHVKNIAYVVKNALQDSNCSTNDISAVAFTQGPGLLGSLLVGSSYAKGFAFSLGIPLIAVNHMKAHVMANFIEEPYPDYPLLCLTVSGGHTQIVQVSSPYDFKLLGKTLDDAVGEAFDKIAKMLTLTYPGGPVIDKYAKDGNPNTFKFPLTNLKNLNFSFSGIKTAFKYFLNKELSNNQNFVKENIHNLCASIQKTLVDMLMIKVKQAIQITGIRTITLAGGVASNSLLRSKIKELENDSDIKTFYPKPQYCTDNAAMVAKCAYYQYLNKDFASYDTHSDPNMNI